MRRIWSHYGQPQKWYPCESGDVYVCDDPYVYDTVHVPDLFTSSSVGSITDTQSTVNKEALVAKGATDLIAGPSHMFSHHTAGIDCLKKGVTHNEVDYRLQQAGCIPSDVILPRTYLIKGYSMT